jgi:hypothetical protein
MTPSSSPRLQPHQRCKDSAPCAGNDPIKSWGAQKLEKMCAVEHPISRNAALVMLLLKSCELAKTRHPSGKELPIDAQLELLKSLCASLTDIAGEDIDSPDSEPFAGIHHASTMLQSIHDDRECIERLIQSDPLRNTVLGEKPLESRSGILIRLIIDPQVVDAAIEFGFELDIIARAYEDQPHYFRNRLMALDSLFGNSQVPQDPLALAQALHQIHVKDMKLLDEDAPVPHGLWLEDGGFGIALESGSADRAWQHLMSVRDRLNGLQTAFDFTLNYFDGGTTFYWGRRPFGSASSEKREEALMKLLQIAAETFKFEFDSAKTDDEKSLAIIRLGQTIELIHPFHDANLRTITDLMNHLEHSLLGWSPTCIDNPNDLDWRLPEELLQIRQLGREKLQSL